MLLSLNSSRQAIPPPGWSPGWHRDTRATQASRLCSRRDSRSRVQGAGLRQREHRVPGCRRTGMQGPRSAGTGSAWAHTPLRPPAPQGCHSGVPALYPPQVLTPAPCPCRPHAGSSAASALAQPLHPPPCCPQSRPGLSASSLPPFSGRGPGCGNMKALGPGVLEGHCPWSWPSLSTWALGDTGGEEERALSPVPAWKASDLRRLVARGP